MSCIRFFLPMLLVLLLVVATPRVTNAQSSPDVNQLLELRQYESARNHQRWLEPLFAWNLCLLEPLFA